MSAIRPQKPYIVLLGESSDEVLNVLREAANMAGEELNQELDANAAVGLIEQATRKPTAIVVNMGNDDAANQAIAVRSHFSLAAVPIIGVVSRVGDLVFEEAFSSGMDDVSSLSSMLLGRRLRQLEDIGQREIERKDQVVVIADRDRNTRLLIGRVFRDAGLQVQFALDPDDALKQALDPKVLVVVVSAEIETRGSDGEPLSTRAPRAGSQAAWIINTPPKEMAATRARIGIPIDAKVAVHDAFASPATLLFVANELVNKPAEDGRKSERLLYGTSVRFRQAGRESEDIGYLYNISKGGLYVRTMAPPDRWDELWLEFVPPRSDRRVHIEGTVVWARRFGPAGSATVPTGFGVQITGGSKADLERYERSYSTFLAERVAIRESMRPAMSEAPHDL